MRKAGPITSAGWPKLPPGATRARTRSTAALAGCDRFPFRYRRIKAGFPSSGTVGVPPSPFPVPQIGGATVSWGAASVAVKFGNVTRLGGVLASSPPVQKCCAEMMSVSMPGSRKIVDGQP